MPAQSGLGFSGIVAIQIPDDGATGEVLTKVTPDDYDYDWQPGGGGGGIPTQITVTDESGDTTCFPLFVTAPTGNLGPKTNAGLTFDSVTGDLVATLIAGILAGDLVDKTAAETITGIWDFDDGAGNIVRILPVGTFGIVLDSQTPVFKWYENDGAVDEKFWAAQLSGGTWNLMTRTDIDTFGEVAITIQRTGVQVTDLTLSTDNLVVNAATVDINGAVDISGALTALSYGGILEANLVDKTAIETISGAWTFTGALTYDNDVNNLTISTTGTNGLFITDPVTFEFGIMRLSATDDLQFVASGPMEFFPHGAGAAVITLSSSLLSAPTLDADFDAITGTSFGGILEANLVDKSAAETITGDWDFTDAGSTFAGAAALVLVANEAADATSFPLFVTNATGNLGPKTNASIAFNASTGQWTFNPSTASAGPVITSTQPRLNFWETDGGVDEKNWSVRANTGVWALLTHTDADPTTAVITALSFSRAGTDINAVTLNTIGTLTINGNTNHVRDASAATVEIWRLTESSSGNFMTYRYATGGVNIVWRPAPAGAADITHDFLFDFTSDRWQFDRDIRFAGGPISLGAGLIFDEQIPAFTVGLRIADVANTDFLAHTHDGVDGFIAGTNTRHLDITNLTGELRLRDGAGLVIFDATDTDSGFFDHDGTDFRLVGTNTAKFLITGITSLDVVNYEFDVDQAVGAGQDAFVLTYENATGLISLKAATGGIPTQITVANEAADATCFPAFFTDATGNLAPKTNAGLTFNASTADLNSTLIAGIANANLVDKSATEAITGAWTFGTAAQIEFLGGTDVWIRDAGVLRIHDAGDTDFVDFSHNGTVFTLAGTNTTELVITGMNVNFSDNQALNFRIENRTSDPGSPTVGEIWLRTDL